MDAFGLIVTLFFSLVGMVVFASGKKNANLIHLACGILLMVYPYAVSNDILLVLIGAILSAIAWFFRDGPN